MQKLKETVFGLGQELEQIDTLGKLARFASGCHL